jgi:hypothetical protein
MTFPFEPPLQLAGTPIAVVRTVADATCFLRNYIGHRPATRDTILRRLMSASSELEIIDAAKSFQWWAEQERFLLSTE